MRLGAPPLAAVLLVTVSTLTWAGCGGGGGDITEPELGTLEVTTATSGTEPDADGYALSLDGGAGESVGPNARLRWADLPTGIHTVELSGVAPNCTLTGDSRRSVTVTGAGLATAAFSITCAPTTGTVQVTTSTTGEFADPDGYVVLVDGTTSGAVGVSGSASVAALPPGTHSVGLGGLAGNCRVEGDNPQTLTVNVGETTSIGFAVVCETPTPGLGSLEIITATTGADLDLDGYRVRIDAGPLMDIGANATVTVPNLSVGSHTVELRNMAANCLVAEANPRTVDVGDGVTVQVSFQVTCTATTGSLSVTTSTSGTPADPDGYTVAVDGGTPSPVGAGATLTIHGLAPGDHTVTLGGIADGCGTTDNPRSVTVVAGQTTATEFAVACAVTTGSLTVTIAGLPDAVEAAVTVSGPGDFTRRVTATRTLRALAPGDYTVAAEEVTRGGTRHVPAPASQTVTVAAGGAPEVAVTYAAAAGGTLNLRIDGWELSQGVLTPENDIPLVANRDGYLRVFVLANEANQAAPAVRVRILQNGTVAETFTIPAPGRSTPTARDEGRLAGSWNVKIPRTLITNRMSIIADVDPANQVAEQNESDNSFPASGTPAAPEVRSAPPLGVRFVPVRQRANGLQGDVTDANRSRYLELARKLYPLSGADGDVHAVYTTAVNQPLTPNDDNGAWITILSEIDALRLTEGTSRNYYGVVRIGYFSGTAGIGYIGVPTAMGYDNEADRSRVMAHELGHNWNRDHAPCGAPGGVDPGYPYPGGTIGVYGIDMTEERLKEPTLPDIMGYCGNPWSSDYTYKGVLDFLTSAGARTAAAASTGEQRSLLVWGRVVDGRPILEPAFEVVTRPSLPARPGPYLIEGRGMDGASLFSISFDAAAVADDPKGTRHFAFTVPLADAARLASLRLSSPQGETSAARAAPFVTLGAADAISARRAAGGVTVRWNAGTHPMVMVRDPRTREVLSFARGGEIDVAGDRSEVEVVVSDRVGSRSLVVPVTTR